MKFQILTISLLSGLMVSCSSGSSKVMVGETDLELLGRQLFMDTNLSEPSGQACVSCHVSTAGFADPDKEIPTSRGIHTDRFGDRNTPTAAYARFTPEFHFDETEGLYIGGQFLDGRAATLEEQAKQPFLNLLEMANPDKYTLVKKVQNSSYADLFVTVNGVDAFNNTDKAFDQIADAIAAFERTDLFSPFTSKYDYFLAGIINLTEQEMRGLDVFEQEDKGNCAACHPSSVAEDGTPPLFTDFTYDNLGVPANPNNSFYQVGSAFNPDGAEFIDTGLGRATADPQQNGKFKVQTLRNIAVTGPYMHNGVFETLQEVVDFYNTRDNGDWPPAEVSDNVNQEELGNLELTDDEVNDLVAYLQTLTDGYELP